MKTRTLILSLWGCFMLPHTLTAQTEEKCYDFDCMMKKARDHYMSGNYEEAVNSAIAAKRYTKADESRADALLKEIFNGMNQLRLKAEEAYLVAKRAEKEAWKSKTEAEADKERALQAERIANDHRDSVIAARDMVDKLNLKGKVLENTFSTTSTYEYLYQTGLQYFQWDQTSQRRDYGNALTYFALARFLNPGDTLDHLVLAAQRGIVAEAGFVNGYLQQAAAEYEEIRFTLEKIAQDPGFELWRLEQIAVVDSLFKEFSRIHDDPLAFTGGTLEGDWWTLPSDFGKYQSVTALAFKNNPATFKHFPAALCALPRLDTLAFIDCPAINTLDDWGCVSGLHLLVLQDNLNLGALENLEALRSLAVLDVRNCPALIRVEGASLLEQLTVEQSPQVRLSQMLQSNRGLKSLTLADLPDTALNTANLAALESLSLYRMRLTNLRGIDQNTRLRLLKMDRLDNLTHFTPPAHLAMTYITRCESLDSLDNWPPSDDLELLVLAENNALKTLPDLKQLPNLQHLLVQQNQSVRHIKGTAALKKAERIYLLNNRNVVTNSVHAGFGVDWGPMLSSLKLEYEHRRTYRWLNNQDFGIKFVAVYTRKIFDNETLFFTREAQGLIAGLVVNYYSPYRIYGGVGVGIGRMQNAFRDLPVQHEFVRVWINNIGIQIAPRFMKQDKISVNIDLYTIFEKNDYFILPSFGFTYYHALGFHRKANFIRPGDSRHKMRVGRDLVKMNRVLERF